MTFRRVDRGRSHQYWDGDRRLTGVTTILGALAKPALIDWAARETAQAVLDRWDDLVDMKPSDRYELVLKARWDAVDKAKLRGTEIHALAEALHRGLQAQVPDPLIGPVEAYARLLEQWDIVATHIETPLINRRWNYAGTLDVIARVRGQLALIDVKTGKGVYPETALQLAAYRYAENVLLEGAEHPMPDVDAVYVAHVLPDDAMLIPVEAGPNQLRAFLYCQQMWAWQQNADALIGSPLRPDPPRLEAVT